MKTTTESGHYRRLAGLAGYENVCQIDGKRQTFELRPRDSGGTIKNILVICTGNSARSQIAEGLFRHYGKDDVEIFSAGTYPAGFVHPLAIETMDEWGIDITDQQSKSLSRYLEEQFDYVITVCDDAKMICPTFPHALHQLHWSTPDPSFHQGTEEERKDAFRQTIRQLERRVKALLEDIRNNKAASK